MISAHKPANEDPRLAALRALEILDTSSEESFNRITRLAARVFNVPIVQISLVDEHREWFKAKCGSLAEEGDRQIAFCAHTILSDDVLVVLDALADARFHDSPMVIGADKIRFYAGAPLRSSSGFNLGAFCLKDQKPRAFPARDVETLTWFASIVVDAMEIRLLAMQAKTATDAKSRFLANMSHEIRTPMTAILGYANLLERPRHSPSERLEAVQTIRRNGEHLLTIINDILDLSKIEAGKLAIECIECSPRRIIAEVESLMRARAVEKKLRLTVDCIGRLPKTIQGDPTRLRQVLMNLVGNAIKFTEAGEVRLTIETIPQPERNTNVIRCRVIDSGIGMTPEQQTRLFEPFSQADTSTTRRFGGSGLGLTISKRLAEMLKGQISIESRLGWGSTFTLTIDVGPLDGVEMTFGPAILDDCAEEEETTVHLHGRLLLAEDGPDNQRLIAFLLGEAGAEVVVAGNGRIAVDMALEALQANKPFDAILMDMQMPELDGYGATAKLRSKGCEIPIIALTAHAMADDREKCIQAGCSDYVSKPICEKTLLSTIFKYLPVRDQSRASAEETDDRADGPKIERGPIRSSIVPGTPIERIVPMFIDGLGEHVRSLNELLGAQDLDQLCRAVHQLKGAGTNYGFAQITESASRAEAAIKSGEDLKTVGAQIGELTELLRRVDGYKEIEQTSRHPATQAGPRPSAL